MQGREKNPILNGFFYAIVLFHLATAPGEARIPKFTIKTIVCATILIAVGMTTLKPVVDIVQRDNAIQRQTEFLNRTIGEFDEGEFRREFGKFFSHYYELRKDHLPILEGESNSTLVRTAWICDQAFLNGKSPISALCAKHKLIEATPTSVELTRPLEELTPALRQKILFESIVTLTETFPSKRHTYNRVKGMENSKVRKPLAFQWTNSLNFWKEFNGIEADPTIDLWETSPDATNAKELGSDSF